MRRLAALATLTSACSLLAPEPPAPAPTPTPAAVTGDTLVVAAPADYTNLNPVVSELPIEGAVIGAIQLPMVTDGFDCALKSTPGLATSWEWSPDGLILTLHLRTDVTWADGTPVTAADVVFTYDLVRDPTVASPRRAFVARMAPGTPTALDEHTVQFQFTKAYDRSAQLAHASLTPVPKHRFANADRGTLRGHPDSLRPLGDGPFNITAHAPGKGWTLQPNAAYTGPDKPRLAKIDFRVIPGAADRLEALKAGTVDWVEGLELADVDALRAARPDVRIVPRGFRANDYVAWNTRLPLFADKGLRRALGLAVNVDALMGSLLTAKDGTVYGKRMVGTITPELCAARADDLAPLPYDPEGATTLLASLGWRDSNADGVLDKDGQKFSFTLRTNLGNPRRQAAAAAIQADLKKIGVEVRVEAVDGTTLLDSLRKHDFEAALAGWNAALFVDPTSFWHTDSPEHPAESNFVGYSNPDVDRLIEQGVATADPAVAGPIWQDVQRRVYDDQPYLFLWWREDLVAVDGRFEHTSIDVLSSLGRLWAWDVPAEKIKYKTEPVAPPAP